MKIEELFTIQNIIIYIISLINIKLNIISKKHILANIIYYN